MAFTRDWLNEIGVPEELIGTIVTEHGRSVQGNKDTINALNTSLKAKDKEIDGLKATVSQVKKDAAVDRALTEAGARYLPACRGAIDLGKVSVDKDGSVKGLSEQIEALKGDGKTAFLFESAKDAGAESEKTEQNVQKSEQNVQKSEQNAQKTEQNTEAENKGDNVGYKPGGNKSAGEKSLGEQMAEAKAAELKSANDAVSSLWA